MSLRHQEISTLQATLSWTPATALRQPPFGALQRTFRRSPAPAPQVAPHIGVISDEVPGNRRRKSTPARKKQTSPGKWSVPVLRPPSSHGPNRPPIQTFPAPSRQQPYSSHRSCTHLDTPFPRSAATPVASSTSLVPAERRVQMWYSHRYPPQGLHARCTSPRETSSVANSSIWGTAKRSQK